MPKPSPDRSSEPVKDNNQVKDSPALIIARTFDSIGRRNESLRAQLDAIEFGFSNIEAIRAHFLDVLPPISDILDEIERTKARHVDSESKLATLTVTHEKLRGQHTALLVERSALAAKQGELATRGNDMEKAIEKTAGELAEARSALAERNTRIERLERELDERKRRFNAVSEQLPSLRAEFLAKEKRLQEVEQQRSAIEDRLNLAVQEGRSLRARIDELLAANAKMTRQTNELEIRLKDSERRSVELEASLNQEIAAHGKLKSAHFDEVEGHRFGVANLEEQVNSHTVRSEAAERMLGDARDELRDRNAAARALEQRVHELTAAQEQQTKTQTELERDLAAVRANHTESEAQRITLEERASDLARSLDDRTAALKRAETQTAALEVQIAQEVKLAIGELEARDAIIAELREKYESQSAARAFAEGALQSARKERSVWAQPSSQGPTDLDRERLARARG
ncbi:MAG: hypothetical protein ACLPN5_12025 [Roseiarcus sp.]